MICNSSFANFGPAISSPTDVCSTTTCVVLKSSLFLESTRGTTGKGSTSSTLASILQPSGGTRPGAPAPNEPAELRSADTPAAAVPTETLPGSSLLLRPLVDPLIHRLVPEARILRL